MIEVFGDQILALRKAVELSLDALSVSRARGRGLGHRALDAR